MQAMNIPAAGGRRNPRRRPGNGCLKPAGAAAILPSMAPPPARLFAIGYASGNFSPYSGPEKATRILGAEQLAFPSTWTRVQAWSWRLGEALRNWGIRCYGSQWNALVPWRDEARILRALPRSAEPYPVHFVFGEFVAPRRVAPYHRRGARVIVSVHCSARRWASVWRRPDGFAQADEVVLMSESQRPFVAAHVPAERIRRILHGVMTEHFTPPTQRPRAGRFRMFLLGNTERDHEFAAQVAARLPAEKFEWRIRTASHERSFYAGLPCVTLLPKLADAEMLAEYRQADVLAMPMLDSAANNVLLESMACGTPVVTNRTGGVAEYVAPDCNFVLSNDRHADEWVAKLLELEQDRDAVERLRPATRAWAEKFDWRLIADEYRAMYRDVLARG